MAIQCSLCGTTLTDEAHFCNICGTLVATHSSNTKTKAPAPPAVRVPDYSRRMLREQIAQQPQSRPDRYAGNSQPPSRMHQLENNGGNAYNSGNTDVKRVRQEGANPPSASNSTSFQAPAKPPQNVGRELHAKVWDQVQTQHLAGDGRGQDARQSQGLLQRENSQKSTDNLPTRPLMAEMPTAVKQPYGINEMPYTQRQGVRSTDVDQLDTFRMATPQIVKPVTPPPLSVAPAAAPTKQRKGRKPLLLIMVIVLLLLIGSGVGAWIMLYTPFSVAGVTQPLQTLHSPLLNITFQYPSGWTTQNNTKKSTLTLSDSSHTAQFVLASHPANGEDAGKYLQQEAAQLSMTGLKPLTTQIFAGISWQELSGSVLIAGASYTETLFAAVHQQHMYTLAQLAPQTTYAQEEQYVFTKIRSSLQFTV